VRTPLSGSRTITRSLAPLPVEPHPDFLPRISSFVITSDNTRCHRGTSVLEDGGTVWVFGLVMRKLHDYLSWFSRVLSRSFALVCLSIACLACLWFCRRPTGIGRAGFLCFSSVEKFLPTPLYKASMHIVRAFFFTQQFTALLFTLWSARFRKALAPSTLILCTGNVALAPAIVLAPASRDIASGPRPYLSSLLVYSYIHPNTSRYPSAPVLCRYFSKYLPSGLPVLSNCDAWRSLKKSRRHTGSDQSEVIYMSKLPV
jgi:hypothetical protein